LKIISKHIHGKRPCAFLCMPETPHVISEDLVLFRKFRDLVIPHIQIVGEAVNQDQIFSFPAQGIAHLDSIGLYFH